MLSTQATEKTHPQTVLHDRVHAVLAMSDDPQVPHELQVTSYKLRVTT